MSEEQKEGLENQEAPNEHQGGEEIDYESLARAEGWAPKEEWRGPDDRWVDAKTFYERGQEILPLVKAKYEKRISTFEEKLRRMEQATESALEHQRQEHLKELKAERKKAIATNDGDKFEQVDDEIRKLEKEPKKEHDPDIEAWHSENQWYAQDADLTDYADTIAPGLRAKFPNLGPRQFLDRLGKEVKKHFPDKFENPRRKTASVENGGSRQKQSKGKTFEDLPDEAKQAFEKIKRKVPSYTSEQYAKSYFEGE